MITVGIHENICMENFSRKRRKGAPQQLVKGKSRVPFKDVSNIKSSSGNLRKKRKSRESSNSIQVSIRVRPPVKHELNSTNVVKVVRGDTISLVNPETNDVKLFTFDKAFTYSNDHEYDQQSICGVISGEILKNANKGYNSCCFCYGQTGSGKTYTMMSSNMNPKKPDGILPQVCRGLFRNINSANQNFVSDIIFKVKIGMVEIYNEKLRDLLNPESNVPLTILDNGDVLNLENVTVDSYHEMLDVIEKGNSFRNTASTAMNERSSRSHTIVQILFSQTYTYGGDAVKGLHSKINLIDLAGSERTKKARTSGLRQKEGISINTSLTHLGLCIRKLSKKHDSGDQNNPNYHVPFRNSKLTYLLKNSLVGNSRTQVIVNISPSSYNSEETKMSLDFAGRMKMIETNAKVNEDIEIRKKRQKMETRKIKEMQARMIEIERKNAEQVKQMKDQWASELNELERVQEESFQMSLDILESEKTEMRKRISGLQGEVKSLQKKNDSYKSLVDRMMEKYDISPDDIEDL